MSRRQYVIARAAASLAAYRAATDRADAAAAERAVTELAVWVEVAGAHGATVADVLAHRAA